MSKFIIYFGKTIIVVPMALIMGGFLVLPALLTVPVKSVHAAINPEINYQAKLEDSSGTAVADDTYTIEFKLYTAPTGGSAIWTESNDVETIDGLLSVMLGGVTSLADVNFNQTLYLGINVEEDGEMTPRKKLGAVPAAFEANKLDGIDSLQFFRNDITNATNSATTSLSVRQNGAGKVAEFLGSSGTGLIIDSSGNVGVGTTTPLGKLHIYNGDMYLNDGYYLKTERSNGTTGNIISIDNGYTKVGNTSENLELYGNSGYAKLDSFAFRIGQNITPTSDGAYSLGDGSTNWANLYLTGNAQIGGTATTTNLNIGSLLKLNGLYGTSGQALVSNGTSSAPTWKTISGSGGVSIGDAVTSGTAGSVLYIDGSGQLAQSNSEFFWDYTNSRLGIGTTSPYAKLSVVGETVSEYFTATSTTATSTFAGGLNVGSGGLVYDFSSGNVGVGTESPTDSLDVNGGIKSTTGLTVNTYTSLTSGNLVLWGSPAIIRNYNSDAELQIGVYDNLGTRITLGTASSGESKIRFYTDGVTERMRIASGGNIGIGTTTPYAKLSVVGETVSEYFTATSTTATSTLPRLTATDFNLTNDLALNGLYGTSGQALVSNGTSSAPTWKTISGSGGVSIGDAVTSGTAGSVLYIDGSGDLAQDNAGFYYDATKNYLNLGTSTDALVIGDITGNERGADAVDIQSARSAVTQVASGAQSVAIGYRNTASYTRATAVGVLNVASGQDSSAFGSQNTASNSYSLAVGYVNTASGSTSSAVGYYNTASGLNSSAFGRKNTSSGQNSLAVGYQNTASTTSSSAVGYTNTASGTYSSAVGYTNTASGNYSSAVGYTNTASGIYSSAFGSSNTASGYGSSAFGYSNTSSNTYSLAVGFFNTASGVYSSVFGSQNTVNANYISAVGYGNAVSGEYSSAFGYSNTGSNTYSSAIGYQNTASGTQSSAVGSTNTTSGEYSSAFGYANTALGIQSSSIGYNNLSSSDYSSAIGYENDTTGIYSSAIGYQNNASYQGTSAFGYVNAASGEYSSAFGYNNASSGTNSSAFGYNNTSSGTNSSAFGYTNTSSGTQSSAFGYSNTSSNTFSSAVGYGNTANSDSSSAFGYSNLVNTSAIRSSAFGYDNTVNTNIDDAYVFGDTNTAAADGAGIVGANLNNSTVNSLMLGPSQGNTIHILSTGEVKLPYLTATSTTATSTFKGGVKLVQSSDSASRGFWISATDGDYRSIYMNTSQVLSFAGGAGNTATLNAAGEWTNASDVSIKSDITELNYGLTELMDLLPRRYKVKAGQNELGEDIYIETIGFVAQEMEAVLPELVHGEEGTKGISYGNLSTVIVNSIQEIGKRINILNAPTSGPSIVLDENGNVSMTNSLGVTGRATVDSLNVGPNTSQFGGAIVVNATNTSSFAGNLAIGNDLLVDGNINLKNATTSVMFDINGITASGSFGIVTNSNDSLFIGQNGYVGVGTTSPIRPLHVFQSTSGSPVRFQDANAYCEINPSDSSWVCTSDERLKEEITDLSSEDILAKFAQLNPVEFEWKTDENNEKRIGLIAQEVENIFPDLVETSEEGEKLKSISYGGFIPYMISAIKNLNNKVNELASRVEEIANSSYAGVIGAFQKITVGSPSSPGGIQMYDEENGDPYCLTIKNGNVITRFGSCDDNPVEVEEETTTYNLEDDNIEIPNVSDEPISEEVIVEEPATEETIIEETPQEEMAEEEISIDVENPTEESASVDSGEGTAEQNTADTGDVSTNE